MGRLTVRYVNCVLCHRRKSDGSLDEGRAAGPALNRWEEMRNVYLMRGYLAHQVEARIRAVQAAEQAEREAARREAQEKAEASERKRDEFLASLQRGR